MADYEFPAKKKKSKNWRPQEQDVLMVQINKWKSTLFAKTLEDTEKKEIWTLIASKVCLASGIARTAEQCREKYNKLRAALGQVSAARATSSQHGLAKSNENRKDSPVMMVAAAKKSAEKRPAINETRRAEIPKKNQQLITGDSSSSSSQGSSSSTPPAQRRKYQVLVASSPDQLNNDEPEESGVFDLTGKSIGSDNDTPVTMGQKVIDALKQMKAYDEEMRAGGYLEESPAPSPIIHKRPAVVQQQHTEVQKEKVPWKKSGPAARKEEEDKEEEGQPGAATSSATLREIGRNVEKSMAKFFRRIEGVAQEMADDLESRSLAK